MSKKRSSRLLHEDDVARHADDVNIPILANQLATLACIDGGCMHIGAATLLMAYTAVVGQMDLRPERTRSALDAALSLSASWGGDEAPKRGRDIEDFYKGIQHLIELLTEQGQDA